MRKFYFVLLACLIGGSLQAGPVDINSADADTLAQELNGVGLSRARAIVDYRDQVGRFQSAEELLNVTGVGEHILDVNRANILVGAPKAQ